MVIFIATCLVAGFIAFPAIMAMNIWNWTANYIAIPFINVWQGAMLWAIVAISGFIINEKGKYLVAFSPKSQLSEAEIKKILERVKMHSQAQTLNSMILKSDDITTANQKDEVLTEKKEKENV